MALAVLEVSLKKANHVFQTPGTNEKSSEIVDFKSLMSLLSQPDIARKEA